MSMLLPPFELHEPRTVEEAARLKRDLPDSDFVAGGTDLLPNYKWGLNARKHVISLARVEGLREISTERIGALVTLSTLEKSGLLAEKLPVVPETARQIATPLLRNAGTLGGNLMLENRCFFFNQTYFWRESKGFCMKADGDACLVVPQKETCYATFSADMPASLIALRASVELASASGVRSVPLSEFYEPDGIHRNQKRPDEMVTGVALPPDATRWRATYQKLRLRDSFDFPELGIAAAIRWDGANVAGFRLVANALETVPVVLDKLGAGLVGEPLTDEAIARVAKDAEAAVRPVKNTFLPPSYRKAMTRVFTERALRALALRS
jgi:4-hydroxybenzoyl-CoA reductase subunit beta